MPTLIDDERDQEQTGRESDVSGGLSDGETDERLSDNAKSESGGGRNYIAELQDRHPAPRTQTSPKRRASLSKRLTKRGAFFAVGGIGFFIIAMLVAFFLFLLGYKLKYIKNLYMDYQFASFNMALSRRLDHIVTEDAILSDDSGALPDGGRPKLYELVRGWSPNQGLRELGKQGVELDFEDGANGRGKLRAIEDTTTGEKFWREGFAPDGTPSENILKGSDFAGKVKEIIGEKLYNESGYFRRKTFADVAERGGFRLSRFTNWVKEKFNGKDPTTAEADKQLTADEIDAAKKGTTNNADLQKKADEISKAAKDGESPSSLSDRIKSSLSDTETLSKVSMFVALTTFYCIFKDLGDHIKDALNTRIDNVMTIAAEEATVSDEQVMGKAPTAVINAENRKFDGYEKSASYDRANNLPVTHPDLPKEDRPETILGLLPDQVQTFVDTYDLVAQKIPETVSSGGACLIPGVSKVCDKVFNYIIDKGCSVVLNPYVQGGVALGELISLFTGIDTAGRSGFEIFKEIMPELFKLGKGVAIGEYIFGHVIPGLIKDIAGVSGAGLNGAADRANRMDAGMNEIKNQTAAASGAHKIPLRTSLRQTNEALALMRAQDRAAGPANMLFNLDNPRSLTARALVALPTTPRAAMAAIGNIFAAIMSPGKLIASLSAPASAQIQPIGEDAFYGIQQYGWEDDELDGTKPGFDFPTNSKYVEANMDKFKSTFAKCFSRKAGDRIFEGNKIKGDDTSNCDDTNPDFRRYGMYVLDCYSVEQMVSATNNDDTFTQSQCSQFVGVTDHPAPSTTTDTSGPGNPTDAPAPPTTITGAVYFLGDSIGVRALNGGLVSDMSKVSINLTINADVARSLTVPGQATHTTAEQVLTIDHDKIAAAKAIVIEMGTNKQDNFSAEQTNFMHNLRTINALAPVYWVNVGSSGYSYWSSFYPAYANTTNATIDSNATTLGYSVINWCKTMFGSTPCVVTPSHPTNGLMDSDGMHPSIPAGVNAFKQMIIQALTNPTAATQ